MYDKDISGILGITYDASQNLCQYNTVTYYKILGTKPKL